MLFDIYTSDLEANIRTLLIILADRQAGGKLKNDPSSYSKKPPCFSEESHWVAKVMLFWKLEQ